MFAVILAGQSGLSLVVAVLAYLTAVISERNKKGEEAIKNCQRVTIYKTIVGGNAKRGCSHYI
jgi:hypothetical protein